MMKYSYRKIVYFTQEEAEHKADRLNGDARRQCVAGVYYEELEEPEGWVVVKYVLRTACEWWAKSGLLPHDHDEGYREGYHSTRKN